MSQGSDDPKRKLEESQSKDEQKKTKQGLGQPVIQGAKPQPLAPGPTPAQTSQAPQGFAQCLQNLRRQQQPTTATAPSPSTRPISGSTPQAVQTPKSTKPALLKGTPALQVTPLQQPTKSSSPSSPTLVTARTQVAGTPQAQLPPPPPPVPVAPAPPPHAVPGQTLPKQLDSNDVKYLAQHTPNCWHVNDYIAEGGFGYVYKVIAGRNQINVQTGRLMAVKVLKVSRQHPDYPSKLQALFRELGHNNFLMEKRLQRPHPNVLVCEQAFNVFDADTQQDRCYMIMELSQLGSASMVLKTKIPKGQAFSEQETRWLVLGVARAVDYLKNFVGLAHCDIKPANILFFQNPDPKVDQNGPQRFIPKLCDFSLAVARDKANDPVGKCCTTGVRCTLGWGPTEAFPVSSSQSYDTFPVDVYSVGLVAYYLRTGLRLVTTDHKLGPMLGAASRNFVFKQQDEVVIRTRLRQSFGGLGVGIANLLMNMLRERPDDRLTIEQVLKHPWFK